MIKASQIKSLEQVENILNTLKPFDSYIRKNRLKEGTYEYEIICEKVQGHLNEIEEALIGCEDYNMSNLARLDSRLYNYWQYLGNKFTFKTLIKKLGCLSDKLLLE